VACTPRYSDYDAFAWTYNRHWGDMFLRQSLKALDKLVLPRMPAGGRILDLCCGTGQLARELTARGLRVTGVDGSEEMLRYARTNAPDARFILADARSFRLPAKYGAAISAFDSLNHVMTLEGLTQVFRNVHAALAPGGRFLFDLNMEEAYLAQWRGSFTIVEDESVCILRPSYDPDEKLGRDDITMFRLVKGAWHRADLSLTQRCYPEGDVRSALSGAGFSEVSTYNAERDFDVRGGAGRTFFLARK
jgi:SAM-dependent methyltransferase